MAPLSPEHMREIASRGGKSTAKSDKRKYGFQDTDTASKAGRKSKRPKRKEPIDGTV